MLMKEILIFHGYTYICSLFALKNNLSNRTFIGRCIELCSECKVDEVLVSPR